MNVEKLLTFIGELKLEVQKQEYELQEFLEELQ